MKKDQNSVNIYAVTTGRENGGTRDQNPQWMERRAANHTFVLMDSVWRWSPLGNGEGFKKNHFESW